MMKVPIYVKEICGEKMWGVGTREAVADTGGMSKVADIGSVSESVVEEINKDPEDFETGNDILAWGHVEKDGTVRDIEFVEQ